VPRNLVSATVCSRTFLIKLFIRFTGASFGRFVNVCSGTVVDGYEETDLNEKTLAADNGR